MSAPHPFKPTWLGEDLQFPDPNLADDEGLVALGGELSVAQLLKAYRSGIFPWSAKPVVTWWSPDPRGIIELDEFHVSSSLAKTVRQKIFTVTFNQAFREVMTACAVVSTQRQSTWITEEFINAYAALHQAGHAHSVECWQGETLVGGVYGVVVGGLFAGESMFHRASNASKVALVHLVEHLRRRQFALFDLQMVTLATAPLGAKAISRQIYLQRLKFAVTRDCVF
jgi:leucyl/phenylalanyl-tRNA--protein transferase